MRKAVFILLLLPCSLWAMEKAEADQLTLQAQDLYAEGQHAEAAHLYDSVLTHFVSADLYFNLGNCYFKTNDLPRAILNYERAWKLAPGDEDIYYNLRAANRLVVDDIGSMPLVDLSNTWKRFQAGENRDQWAFVSLAAAAIGFLLLVGMVLARLPWLKRSAFFLALALFALSATAVILASMRAHDMNERNEAIIFAPKVDVRSEPNASSTRLLILHEGSKVQLQQENGEWIEVRLPNGTGGWIKGSDVEVI